MGWRLIWPFLVRRHIAAARAGEQPKADTQQLLRGDKPVIHSFAPGNGRKVERISRKSGDSNMTTVCLLFKRIAPLP